MENRRNFLQTFGRNIVLFAFGFFGILGLFYKKIKADAYSSCPISLACTGCNRLSFCDKDQVAKYKENKNSRYDLQSPVSPY